MLNQRMASSPNQVLLATRDHGLIQSMSIKLAQAGINLLNATDASETMKVTVERRPSLSIIDASHLPGDVLGLCRGLRAVAREPIIVLLANEAPGLDEATLLDAGVDDCMRYPVSHRELVARVRARLRRGNQPARDVISGAVRAGELEIDVAAHSVRRHGSPVSLTPLEFNLLLHLVNNRGKVLTRTQLLEKVWGWGYATNTRTVDVRVRLLRKKIEADPERPRLVVTVTGVGYRFDG